MAVVSEGRVVQRGGIQMQERLSQALCPGTYKALMDDASGHLAQIARPKS